MFHLMPALKRITVAVLLNIIVGLFAFETIKLIERGCFSLIDAQELLSSPRNIMIILIVICSFMLSTLLFAYYDHENI